MYPSSSSNRSSTSSSRKRRIVRPREVRPREFTTIKTTDASETESQSHSSELARNFLCAFACDGADSDSVEPAPSVSSFVSSISFSGFAAEQEKLFASEPSSSKEPRTSSKRKLRQSYSSEPPMVTFFRMIFLRWFTTRRKKRKRGAASRKMKNSNFKTRDDCGKTDGSPSPKKNYSSIPTNAQEMFFQLHSHSKSKSSRNVNAQALSSNRNTNVQALSRSSSRSRSNSQTSAGNSMTGQIHNHNRARIASSGAISQSPIRKAPSYIVINHNDVLDLSASSGVRLLS